MPGLTGWLIAMAVIALYLVILLLVGIYCLIAREPNLSLLYAVLGALATMLLYFALDPLNELGIPIRRSYHDVIVPVLFASSIVVAIIVYAVT